MTMFCRVAILMQKLALNMHLKFTCYICYLLHHLVQPQCGGAVSVAFTIPKVQGSNPTEELWILLKHKTFFCAT